MYKKKVMKVETTVDMTNIMVIDVVAGYGVFRFIIGYKNITFIR